MMKQKVKERTDLISDLPPSILHHIISYLSSEDSVRTSVLSKQWNSVKKSFPILKFKPPIDHWRFSPRFKERLRGYLDYVDRSLQNFVHDKLCIERMNIHMSMVDRGSVPLVNSWLPLALHNGVSDLKFHVRIDAKCYEEYYYLLPETTFTVTSSSLLHGSSEFFLLKKLELEMVCLTEKIVKDIIRNCPNLADLNLWSLCDMKTLIISKPNKLVSLTITISEFSKKLTSVFIDALSLQHLSLLIQDQELPCEIDLTSCCNLREFDLRNSAITDAQLNMTISRFPLLEVLKIENSSMLRRIRISLQRLKHLRLVGCDFEAIEIDAPLLSEFVFVQSDEDEELPVLVLADANPGSMYLTYNMDFVGDHFDSLRFFKIKEYLIVPFKGITFSLEHFTMVHDDITKISFDLDELRELVIPPPVEIDCLDLTRFSLKRLVLWEPLLDGLLWSCHPKKVQMIMSANSSAEDNCIKILWRMLNKSECQICSNLSHCMCWRSRFKAATIESSGDIKFDELNVTSVTEDFFLRPKYRRVRSRSVYGNYPNPVCCSVMFRFDWED